MFNRAQVLKCCILLSGMLLLSSCGAYRIYDRDLADFSNGGIYPATRADFRGICATRVDLRFLFAAPFLIADLPLAVLVDTLYLPFDATETENDRFIRMHKSLFEASDEQQKANDSTH